MKIRLALTLRIERASKVEPDEPTPWESNGALVERADPAPLGFVIPPVERGEP